MGAAETCVRGLVLYLVFCLSLYPFLGLFLVASALKAVGLSWRADVLTAEVVDILVGPVLSWLVRMATQVRPLTASRPQEVT